MKTLPAFTQFVVLLSLPLLLGGCGEEPERGGENKIVIIGEDTQERDDLVYLIGSKIPYTGIGQWNWLTGEKMWRREYKDGKPHGSYEHWYHNGQKWSEGQYKDGKEVGLWIKWHENGQKGRQENYINGNRHGLKIEWHDNGQKGMEENWIDGRIFSAKYWNSEGDPVESLEGAE